MGIRVNRIVAIRRKSTREDISSPLGQALKDFIMVAGGTYLGIMAVAEFLKIPVPMEAEVWGTPFDPVALFSVALSIVIPALPLGKRKF